MDTKRLFFALILSFTFIVTWNIFFPPEKAEQTDIVLDIKNDAVPPISEQRSSNLPSLAFESKTIYKIKTPLMDLELTNGATSLSSVSLVEINDGYYKHTGMWEEGGNKYLENEPVKLFHNSTCNPCLFIDNKPIEFITYNKQVDSKNNK